MARGRKPAKARPVKVRKPKFRMKAAAPIQNGMLGDAPVAQTEGGPQGGKKFKPGKPHNPNGLRK